MKTEEEKAFTTKVELVSNQRLCQRLAGAISIALIELVISAKKALQIPRFSSNPATKSDSKFPKMPTHIEEEEVDAPYVLSFNQFPGGGNQMTLRILGARGGWSSTSKFF